MIIRILAEEANNVDTGNSKEDKEYRKELEQAMNEVDTIGVKGGE